MRWNLEYLVGFLKIYPTHYYNCICDSITLYFNNCAPLWFMERNSRQNILHLCRCVAWLIFFCDFWDRLTGWTGWTQFNPLHLILGYPFLYGSLGLKRGSLGLNRVHPVNPVHPIHLPIKVYSYYQLYCYYYMSTYTYYRE